MTLGLSFHEDSPFVSSRIHIQTPCFIMESITHARIFA